MYPAHQTTPCPSSSRGVAPTIDLSPRFYEDRSEYDDTTSRIDFTSAFQLSRPVRFQSRTTAIRPKRPGKPLDFKIYNESGPENSRLQPCSDAKPGEFRGEKLSVLSQPAQRPRLKSNFVSHNTEAVLAYHPTTTNENSCQMDSCTGKEPQSKIGEHGCAGDEKKVHKPARRGTVYIPSDDTTMPTMGMGIFNPIKELGLADRNLGEGVSTDLSGIAAKMAQKCRRRTSSVMAAPRRGPLTQAQRPPQVKTFTEDVAGPSTGKENLPPGHISAQTVKLEKMEALVDCSSQPRSSPRRSRTLPRNRQNHEPSTLDKIPGLDDISVLSSQPEEPYKLHLQKIESASQNDIDRVLGHLRLQEGECRTVPSPASNRVPKLSPPRPPTVKPVATPGLPATTKRRSTNYQSYPVLREDIQTPSLYEENWLNHQEIAITQLVNDLFDATWSRSLTTNVPTPRSQLLAIYQDQSMVLLHKRLEASLLYGSLSAPQATLAKPSKLGEDLGMKQRFLDLWLDTYDLPLLQACAEIVIGRECSSGQRNLSGAEFSSCGQPGRDNLRQRLSRYLERFLVGNEDKTRDRGRPDSGIAKVQRTLLRSLMLIKLLDVLKSLPRSQFRGCLFQASSPHKSSTSVIQALVHQVQPCIGNVLRSLSHLDYVVSHVQQPLEEYDYRLDNLAVDFRDGVKLTRLVEVLLYPSTSRPVSAAADVDATTTIAMPTGDTLSLSFGGHDRPLSQHLKFPCLGRVTKVYNCQIALGALKGINGFSKIAEQVQAEDIVDGFREKTVALLWSLASQWGLGSLINWPDVKREVYRMGGGASDMDIEDVDDGFGQHKGLLQCWAAAAAARKGLRVDNLSTSFADGRVFAAIVDEYEPFLNASKGSSKSSSASEAPLSQRLAALGCSEQFASLFDHPSTPCVSSSRFTTAKHNSNNSHMYTSSTARIIRPPAANLKIFDHDFTLAALAFLASRLLSASEPGRAAVAIQRFWRCVLHRRDEQCKAVAKRLAGECQVVVQARERLGWAKTVIWRAWSIHRLRKQN